MQSGPTGFDTISFNFLCRDHENASPRLLDPLLLLPLIKRMSSHNLGLIFHHSSMCHLRENNESFMKQAPNACF